MTEPSKKSDSRPSFRFFASCGRWVSRPVIAFSDVAAVAAGAIALFAFAARFSWAADLCCQFRVQLLMLLVPATIIYWIVRRGTVAWWLLVCSVANLQPLLPYVIPKADVNSVANSNENVTRIMMLNVLKSNKHYDDVIDYVQEHDPDMFIAIEADQAWTEGLNPIRADYSYRQIVDDRGTASIAVYSRIPFDSVDVHHSTRHRLPSLDLKVTIDQEPIHICATHPYVPLTRETARMRNEQLREISHLMSHQGSRILLGDFNCTPWSPHFVDVLRAADVTPAGYGRGLRPTWYRRARAYGPLLKTWVFALKLDHVLLSDDLRAVNHLIGPCLGSDHRPIIVDFARKRSSP